LPPVSRAAEGSHGPARGVKRRRGRTAGRGAANGTGCSVLETSERSCGDVEQYHEVNERMGIRGDGDAPGGLVWHVAGRTDDGVLVADVWESREQFERFFRERAGQALADAGVEAGEPLVLPVHNLIARGAGAEPRVIVLI